MLHFKRDKKRVGLILSIVYRFFKLGIWGKKQKMKLLLDLEWMFNRMSLEQAYELYSLKENPMKKESLKFLLPKIDSSFKVLDLGCKRGELAYEVSKVAKEVVGVDHNASCISDARKMHQAENLSFVNDDAIHFLEEKDHQFDLLVMSHILEHIDDPSDLLKRFKKYFKYIFVEIPDFHANYLNLFRKDAGVELLYTDRDHIWEFDREGIQKIFEKEGLDVVHSEFRFGVQKYFLKLR